MSGSGHRESSARDLGGAATLKLGSICELPFGRSAPPAMSRSARGARALELHVPRLLRALLGRIRQSERGPPAMSRGARGIVGFVGRMPESPAMSRIRHRARALELHVLSSLRRLLGRIRQSERGPPAMSRGARGLALASFTSRARFDVCWGGSANPNRDPPAMSRIRHRARALELHVLSSLRRVLGGSADPNCNPPAMSRVARGARARELHARQPSQAFAALIPGRRAVSNGELALSSASLDVLSSEHALRFPLIVGGAQDSDVLRP